MPEVQFTPEPGIKALMVEHDLLARIKVGELSRVEIDRSQSWAYPGGDSLVYNYYGPDGAYTVRLIR